jgi:hypothetical protein
MFTYTPGAKYWIGDFVNGLPKAQAEAYQTQAEGQGGLRPTNLFTVPSEANPGKIFELFVWLPFEGNQTYLFYEGSHLISDVDVCYDVMGIMPHEERVAISMHWPEHIRPLAEPKNIIVAPDAPPVIKDGKFYWGDYRIDDFDLDLWPIDRKIMHSISSRIKEKSPKVINTRRSARRCNQIIYQYYSKHKFKIEPAKPNRSGYKTAISLIVE